MDMTERTTLRDFNRKKWLHFPCLHEYYKRVRLSKWISIAEAEWFYEDLQDLLKLTPKKDVPFIVGDWNAKIGSHSVMSDFLRPYGL